MNKKALATKFMIVFIFLIVIILLGLILSLIISSHEVEKKDEFNVHRSLLETQYQTRTVLMQEFEDKKIYQHLLDDYNQHGVDAAVLNTSRMLHQYNPGTNWYVYVSGTYLPDDKKLRTLSTIIPDFLIPNTEGQDLRVKIKILKEGDFELNPKW